MGQIASWLQDRKPQLQRLVDTTDQDVLNGMRNDPLLDEYFPIETYDDFKILWLQFKDVAAIASVVGFEGEIPGTRTGNITEAELQVFKLGIAHHYTENLQIMMHEFKQRALAVPALMTQLNRILFGSVEDLGPRLNGLMRLMAWQVIYSASCNYLDSRTKITAKIDYAKEATLFPTALATTRRWSQPATATGVADIVALMEAFYAIHRYFPDKVVMSRKAVNQLLKQESTKTLAIQRVASAATATQFTVNRNILNELLMDQQVPPIVEFDDSVIVETVTTGAGGVPVVTPTSVRLLPENVFTFLSKRPSVGGQVPTMGTRALGPVVSNQMRAGIYTFPEAVSIEPPLDRVVGVCTYVPAVWDSRTLAAQVIDS